MTYKYQPVGGRLTPEEKRILVVDDDSVPSVKQSHGGPAFEPIAAEFGFERIAIGIQQLLAALITSIAGAVISFTSNNSSWHQLY